MNRCPHCKHEGCLHPLGYSYSKCYSCGVIIGYAPHRNGKPGYDVYQAAERRVLSDSFSTTDTFHNTLSVVAPTREYTP